MKHLRINRLVLFTGLMLGLLLVLAACGEEEDPNALRVPMGVVEGTVSDMVAELLEMVSVFPLRSACTPPILIMVTGPEP